MTDRPTMDGLRPTLPAGADRSVARRWAERATTVLAVCALVPTLARTTMLLVDALQDPARGTLRFVVELLLNLAVSLVACSLGVRAWERRRRWPVEETPLFLLVFAPLAWVSLAPLWTAASSTPWPRLAVTALLGLLNAAVVVLALYLAGATRAASDGTTDPAPPPDPIAAVPRHDPAHPAAPAHPVSRRTGCPKPTELAAAALAGYSLLSSLGWATRTVWWFVDSDRARSDDDVAMLLIFLVVPLVVAVFGVLVWVRRQRWPALATPPFVLVFAPLAYHSLNVLLRHTGPLTLPWSVVLAVSGVLNAAAVVVVLYLAGATVAARSALPGKGRKAAAQ